jgi:hypothetical protein
MVTLFSKARVTAIHHPSYPEPTPFAPQSPHTTLVLIL